MPVDHTQVNKPTTTKPTRHQHCGTLVLDLLRHSLHRFIDLKWPSFRQWDRPRTQPVIVFHDADGVQLCEKLGGTNRRTFSYAELYVDSKGLAKTKSSEVEDLGGSIEPFYRATEQLWR